MFPEYVVNFKEKFLQHEEFILKLYESEITKREEITSEGKTRWFRNRVCVYIYVYVFIDKHEYVYTYTLIINNLQFGIRLSGAFWLYFKCYLHPAKVTIQARRNLLQKQLRGCLFLNRYIDYVFNSA